VTWVWSAYCSSTLPAAIPPRFASSLMHGSSTAWVTRDREHARTPPADESVLFARWATTRNVRNLLRNLQLEWTLVLRLRPVILTTGTGVVAPFAWIGRLWCTPKA
jgi:hypothetical protein